MKDEVLHFWFETLEPPMWWRADPVLDAQIRERFADLLKAAAAGDLFEWRDDARGRLAEIIVLDQFSRNIHRDTPGAVAQDPMALALVQSGPRLAVPARRLSRCGFESGPALPHRPRLPGTVYKKHKRHIS